MDAWPNTTVSVLTATAIDPYSGERTESTTATEVPAARAEQSRNVQDPRTGSPRVVRYTTIRLPAGTTVTSDSRLLDEADSTYFAVQSVRQHRLAGRVGDVICDVARMDNTQP